MPLIFTSIKAEWDTLDNLLSDLQRTDLVISSPYIRSLQLREPSSWGEWHKAEQLSRLFEQCSGLNTVNICISGSSNWMKYLSNVASISHLKIKSAISNQQGDSKGKLHLASFDISHLSNFSTLHTIELDGFNVRNEALINGTNNLSEKPTNNISRLKLVDCMWEYPFDISDLCPIEDLNVIYTCPTGPFTYSERLKSLTQSPPLTVKNLNLSLQGCSPQNQKAWLPLAYDKCEQLESLTLEGFTLPGSEFFQQLPSSLKRLNLNYSTTSTRFDKSQFLSFIGSVSFGLSLQIYVKVLLWNKDEDRIDEDFEFMTVNNEDYDLYCGGTINY
jgi:hypothetical protein